MGQSQCGILEVWGGKDHFQGVQTDFCHVVPGVSPLCPSHRALTLCYETHDVPLLIHVTAWLNMQKLIGRSDHITFKNRLICEKGTCVFSTGFGLGSKPGSDGTDGTVESDPTSKYHILPIQQ